VRGAPESADNWNRSHALLALVAVAGLLGVASPWKRRPSVRPLTRRRRPVGDLLDDFDRADRGVWTSVSKTSGAMEAGPRRRLRTRDSTVPWKCLCRPQPAKQLGANRRYWATSSEPPS